MLSERCLANHWDFFQENQSTEGPHMLTARLRPETRSILVPEDTETLRKNLNKQAVLFFTRCYPYHIHSVV